MSVPAERGGRREPAAGELTVTGADPGTTPVGDPPQGEPYAAVAETHTSVLISLGGLVYKVKKPLRLAFIDLSRVEDRWANCLAEVELNRRIAPDVYLGVGHLPCPLPCPLPGPVSGPVPGEPVVVMRRMPLRRRLSSLIAAGDDVTGTVCAVARQVAVMHAGEPPVHGFDLAGTMASLWRAGREQLIPFENRVLPRETLDEVAGLAAEYLHGRAGLLAAREAAGEVRDGHGDLLADDIFCLDDGPRILDCLEFDAALRVGDVLADVAFLVMDLHAHGRGDLAELFWDRYRCLRHSDAPRSLLEHYVAYRAFVRAKVECLRHDQGDGGAAARAVSMLRLCRRRLAAARVHLVLIGGLPGSGKSTLAEALADGGSSSDSGSDGGSGSGAREWALLSSDVVRKEAAGVDPFTSRAAGFGTGLYDPGHTAATYRELLHRADLALRRGVSVVIDASWTDEAHRRRARSLAASASARLTEVECRAGFDVCRRRLGARSGPHVSDADPAVLQRMAAVADPWPEAHPVATDGPVHDAAAALRQALERG